MALSQGEDNEEDEMLGEEELGTQSPGSYAAQVWFLQNKETKFISPFFQVLDVLSLNLPPERVFLPVVSILTSPTPLLSA